MIRFFLDLLGCNFLKRLIEDIYTLKREYLDNIENQHFITEAGDTETWAGGYSKEYLKVKNITLKEWINYKLKIEELIFNGISFSNLFHKLEYPIGLTYHFYDYINIELTIEERLDIFDVSRFSSSGIHFKLIYDGIIEAFNDMKILLFG